MKKTHSNGAIKSYISHQEKIASETNVKVAYELVDKLDHVSIALERIGQLDAADMINDITANIMQALNEKTAGFGDRSLNSLINSYQKKITTKLSQENMTPESKKAVYVGLRNRVARNYKRAAQKLRMVQADLEHHHKMAQQCLKGDHIPDTEDLAESCAYVHALSETLAF